MKNLSGNKTPQATCDGDITSGSAVRGMLGASFHFKGGVKENAILRGQNAKSKKKKRPNTICYKAFNGGLSYGRMIKPDAN